MAGGCGLLLVDRTSRTRSKRRRKSARRESGKWRKSSTSSFARCTMVRPSVCISSPLHLILDCGEIGGWESKEGWRRGRSTGAARSCRACSPRLPLAFARPCCQSLCMCVGLRPGLRHAHGRDTNPRLRTLYDLPSRTRALPPPSLVLPALPSPSPAFPLPTLPLSLSPSLVGCDDGGEWGQSGSKRAPRSRVSG